MTSTILTQFIDTNILKVNGLMDRLTPENSQNRINPQTGTAGFYMRHIAEAQIMLPKRLLGTTTALPYEKPFTLGISEDDGRYYDVEETKQLLAAGYATIKELIANYTEEDWNEKIQSFWGEVTKLDCFARILNHNAHHCGQIELAIKKGNK